MQDIQKKKKENNAIKKDQSTPDIVVQQKRKKKEWQNNATKCKKNEVNEVQLSTEPPEGSKYKVTMKPRDRSGLIQMLL